MYFDILKSVMIVVKGIRKYIPFLVNYDDSDITTTNKQI